MGTLVSLFNRISNRFRQATVWLLIGLIPVHAAGWAIAELRGPAHYHDHASADFVDPVILTEPGELPGEPRDHDHSHSAVERHHHGAADEPVFVDDGSEHQHDALAIDEGASGSGSLFSYAALTGHNLGCAIIDLGHARPGCAQKALANRSVGRIERPPATGSG